MNRRRHAGGRKIVLAVTSDVSLRFFTGLPERLTASEWDVHIVSAPGRNQDEWPRIDGVTVHSIPMAREPSLLHDTRSLWRWLKLIRRLKPTTVLVGTPKAALLGSISAWIARVPDRIYMVRGLRLETAEGALLRILTLMERITFRASTRSVSVSHSLRQRILELGLTRPDKIEVLGAGSSNGVDPERFNTYGSNSGLREQLQVQLGIDPSVPTIGFVGRLTPDKGLGVLSDALVELSKRGVAFQIIIVGPADSQVHDKLMWDLQAGVFYTGMVADTAPYYRLMDVFCLPTRREGFPNYRVGSSNHVMNELRVCNRSLNELNIEPLEVRSISSTQIVEHHDTALRNITKTSPDEV